MSIFERNRFLILIIMITFLARIYQLNYPKTYVFDEVYHAFTAKEYLKGSKEAWQFWATPPKGVAYEWTHPPLAKEIMAASMFIIGSQEEWAFRLPGVLLGTLSVLLVYLLGMKLLKNGAAALIAAFVFSIDGLNFVQSRTGMNDAYFVTFMLASLLFLLNKRLIISAIFLGLSLASKWTAVYTYLIIIPLLLKDQRYKDISYFIAIPILTYLISYLPFFLSGHNFLQFIDLQQQMWWYHSGLRATHSYSSPWWSWPLNLYPVWYFVDYSGEKIANIFASGNPAVFWVGIATIILTALQAVRNKSENLMIIVLGFLIFWLPWAISPRIMFLYHFSPSVPFLTLALGYKLSLLLKDKKGSKLAVTVLILMALSFIIIFPFLTGIPLPKSIINLT